MAGGWVQQPSSFISRKGRLGLPGFAGTPQLGIVLVYMAGPTGGYSVGFVVAEAITGLPSFAPGDDRDRLSVALATGAIYLLGAGWLATLIGPDQGDHRRGEALPARRSLQAPARHHPHRGRPGHDQAAARRQELRWDPAAPNARGVGRAAALLREGRLVAFPTETVYGLGGDATSDAAVAAI